MREMQLSYVNDRFCLGVRDIGVPSGTNINFAPKDMWVTSGASTCLALDNLSVDVLETVD